MLRHNTVKKFPLDSNMFAEIDLHDNAGYVVTKGRIIKVERPPSGYGKLENS